MQNNLLFRVAVTDKDMTLNLGQKFTITSPIVQMTGKSTPNL